jgi:transcription elongation factor
LGENDSDEDRAETRNFFARDSSGMDLVIGDKIFITEGDL